MMQDLQSVAARPVVPAGELAGWLGVSRRTINTHDRAGRLGRSWRIGRAIVFSGSAVARFIQEQDAHRRPPPPNVATKDKRGHFLSTRHAE